MYKGNGGKEGNFLSINFFCPSFLSSSSYAIMRGGGGKCPTTTTIPVLPSFMSCHTRCLIFILVTQKNVLTSREKEKSGPLNPSFLPFPLCPTEGSEKKKDFLTRHNGTGFSRQKESQAKSRGQLTYFDRLFSLFFFVSLSSFRRRKIPKPSPLYGTHLPFSLPLLKVPSFLC